MNSLNQIILEGENVRVIKDNNSLFAFLLEVKRTFKNANGEMVEEISNFEIENWAGLAEVCRRMCNVGRGVRIVGRLKQNRWEDDMGMMKTKVVVISEYIEFKPYLK